MGEHHSWYQVDLFLYRWKYYQANEDYFLVHDLLGWFIKNTVRVTFCKELFLRSRSKWGLFGRMSRACDCLDAGRATYAVSHVNMTNTVASHRTNISRLSVLQWINNSAIRLFGTKTELVSLGVLQLMRWAALTWGLHMYKSTVLDSRIIRCVPCVVPHRPLRDRYLKTRFQIEI